MLLAQIAFKRGETALAAEIDGVDYPEIAVGVKRGRGYGARLHKRAQLSPGHMPVMGAEQAELARIPPVAAHRQRKRASGVHPACFGPPERNGDRTPYAQSRQNVVFIPYIVAYPIQGDGGGEDVFIIRAA